MVQTWLTFGFEWGSETLSASYRISDGVFNEENMLATNLSFNTPYEAKIEYIIADNQFIISAAGNTVTVKGPPRIGDAAENAKFLLTGIWLPPEDIGSVSASFDDVYVNGTLYDDFSSGVLDGARWWPDEIVRKVNDGRLNLSVYNSGQEFLRWGKTNSLIMKDIVPKSVEAEFKIKSDSWFSSGANGIAGILGQHYNDTYGPGSGKEYNGLEGDVFSVVHIDMRSDRTLTAIYAVLRVDDAKFNSFTYLISGNFITQIDMDTPVILGSTFDPVLGQFIFSCNDEQIFYSISTPIYPATNPQCLLRSRVYSDVGQPGYIFVDVDNVYINSGQGKSLPGVMMLLLDE